MTYLELATSEKDDAMNILKDSLDKDIHDHIKNVRLKIPGTHKICKCELHWNVSNEFWYRIFFDNDNDQYWCGYGVHKPVENGQEKIIVETTLNYSRSSINIRGKNKGGILIKDEVGCFFLAHTGNINGLNIDDFLNYMNNEGFKKVLINGVKVIIITCVNDVFLSNNIAKFVKTVDNIKNK